MPPVIRGAFLPSPLAIAVVGLTVRGVCHFRSLPTRLTCSLPGFSNVKLTVDAPIHAQDDSSGEDRYRTFVEGVSKSETENPLDDVVASTLLGSPKFISWAKERFIDLKNADMRNIPVLRKVVDKPLLEQIAVNNRVNNRQEASIFQEDVYLCKSSIRWLLTQGHRDPLWGEGVSDQPVQP